MMVGSIILDSTLSQGFRGLNIDKAHIRVASADSSGKFKIWYPLFPPQLGQIVEPEVELWVVSSGAQEQGRPGLCEKWKP